MNNYETLINRLEEKNETEASEAISDLTNMLKQFANYGEQLWDEENFRLGYKKIPSGHLVDCRNLLRKFGISFEEE